MFKLTRLIHLKEGASEAEREAALSALRKTATAHPLIRHALVEWTLPGHINGGDILWHMQFDSKSDYEAAKASGEWARDIAPALAAPVIERTDFCAYEGGTTGVRKKTEPRENTVYRLAFLAKATDLPDTKLALFETDMLAMPDYIKEIRNWQLSHVVESDGLRPWAYVWEQEFGEAADLGLDFTYSPHHWAHVGRWFEPESPDHLIDTCICHVLCNARPGFPILTDAIEN